MSEQGPSAAVSGVHSLAVLLQKRPHDVNTLPLCPCRTMKNKKIKKKAKSLTDEVQGSNLKLPKQVEESSELEEEDEIPLSYARERLKNKKNGLEVEETERGRKPYILIRKYGCK